MSTRLMQDMERAAAEEQSADALRAEIERLRSELARLTPSGQVADAAATIRRALATAPYSEDKDAALANTTLLAAQAQGYEAMKAERDAAVARADAEAHSGDESRKHLLQALKERDATVADYAALMARIRSFSHAEACAVEDEYDADETDGCVCALALVAVDAGRPHPGAALLAVHAKALVRARNKARFAAEDEARRLKKEAAGCVGMASDEMQKHGWLMAAAMADDIVRAIRALQEPEL